MFNLKDHTLNVLYSMRQPWKPQFLTTLLLVARTQNCMRFKLVCSGGFTFGCWCLFIMHMFSLVCSEPTPMLATSACLFMFCIYLYMYYHFLWAKKLVWFMSCARPIHSAIKRTTSSRSHQFIDTTICRN